MHWNVARNGLPGSATIGPLAACTRAYHMTYSRPAFWLAQDSWVNTYKKSCNSHETLFLRRGGGVWGRDYGPRAYIKYRRISILATHHRPVYNIIQWQHQVTWLLRNMSHGSVLIGTSEIRTAESASPRKCSIYTRPFSSREGGVWGRDY